MLLAFTYESNLWEERVFNLSFGNVRYHEVDLIEHLDSRQLTTAFRFEICILLTPYQARSNQEQGWTPLKINRHLYSAQYLSQLDNCLSF